MLRLRAVAADAVAATERRHVQVAVIDRIPVNIDKFRSERCGCWRRATVTPVSVTRTTACPAPCGPAAVRHAIRVDDPDAPAFEGFIHVPALTPRSGRAIGEVVLHEHRGRPTAARPRSHSIGILSSRSARAQGIGNHRDGRTPRIRSSRGPAYRLAVLSYAGEEGMPPGSS